MAWPSKNPDDYVGTPMWSPSLPAEKVGSIDELDPADWRAGWVPPLERLAWLPIWFPVAYAAGVLGGIDLSLHAPLGPVMVLSAVVTEFLGRRSRAARRANRPRAFTLRSAPANGLPFSVTVLVTFGVSLLGSAAVGLATTHERWQYVGVLSVLAVAPVAAKLLERRAASD